VAGFLGKWLGQPAPAPPEVAAALADLARIRQERPALAGPAVLLGDLLPGLYADPGSETVPALSPKQASVKLADGIPLLRGEALAIDLRAFRKRGQHACATLGRHQPGDAVQALGTLFQNDPGKIAAWVPEVLAGRPETVHAQAVALGLDPGLTATVLRLTLFPALSRVSKALAPLCQRHQWGHGFCPICGSRPLLGEYRGLEQTRWLRCGFCASGWEFPRLGCPCCGSTDHRRLGYLHVEGQEAEHRAATCDACHGYVKMVATLAPLDGPALLVADIATLHLDLAAAERGYGGFPQSAAPARLTT
jgi:FdhE protein